MRGWEQLFGGLELKKKVSGKAKQADKTGRIERIKK